MKRGIFVPYLADLLLPNSAEDKKLKERREIFINIGNLDTLPKNLLEDKENIDLLKDTKLRYQENIDTLRNGFKNEEDTLINKNDELM